MSSFHQTLDQNSAARPPLQPRGPERPALIPNAAAPRQQYLDLKGNVHKKLLNRLNLEALAQTQKLDGGATLAARAARERVRLQLN